MLASSAVFCAVDYRDTVLDVYVLYVVLRLWPYCRVVVDYCQSVLVLAEVGVALV